MHEMTRRDALISSILVSLAAGITADAAGAQQAESEATVLVTYFTRTGNTSVIANQIRTALQADIFRIEPADAYPEDYEAQVAQAEEERQAGFEPPLKALVPNLSPYATVFLGFPIWGMTAPSVIRSFLSRHDLSGKTLVPFITHGGYGLGSSLSVVAEHAPRARLLDGFSKECDQERETLGEVTQWLDGIALPGAPARSSR
jgi:flavodoxin